MAKRKVKPVDIEDLAKDKPAPKRRDSFVNSEGIKVQCLPVDPTWLVSVYEDIKQQYRKAGEPIDAPTYVMSGFGGVEDTAEYDKESIKEAPPEDKEKWRLHKEAAGRMVKDQGAAAVKFLIVRGIKNEPPKIWLDERKFFGLSTDKGFKTKYDYAEDKLIKTEKDTVELSVITAMLATKGLTEEEYAQQERNFRGLLDRELERKRNGSGKDKPPGDKEETKASPD